jgi:small subunit ribosomal protein S1
MFKITLAKVAGFCFGVKRAMSIAEQTAKKSHTKPVYTFGPLIHNPQAVSYLKSIGVNPIDNFDGVKPGKLIVRSHGVPPLIIELAREKGFDVVDATCPFVRRAQDFAKTLLKEEYKVLVIGEAKHPEVIGIVGHTNQKGTIIENESDIDKLKNEKKIGVVTQTTQSVEKFKLLISKILEKGKEIRIFNTICSATLERQEATLQLAQKADTMIIIGGKNSANTTHLAQLSRKTNKPTYHIERAEEIDPDWLKGKQIVGISAGASTPSFVINKVIAYLQSLNEKVSDPSGSRLLYKEEVLND